MGRWRPDRHVAWACHRRRNLLNTPSCYFHRCPGLWLPIFELSTHGAGARADVVEHPLVWLLDGAVIYCNRVAELRPKHDDRLQAAESYQEGFKQLKHAAEGRCFAIMCSEADYRKCHRYWLITRLLVNKGVEVHHILHSGDLVQTRPDEFAPAPRQLG